MPQEENEDDLYAYDTVADQTDAEIAGIGRFFDKFFVLPSIKKKVIFYSNCK